MDPEEGYVISKDGEALTGDQLLKILSGFGELCGVLEVDYPHFALAPTKQELDHEAMEELRFHSLKRGWKWQWDGIDLRQVTLGPNAPNTHDDPADAVLAERKEGGDADLWPVHP